MQRTRLHRLLEQLVELVVERPKALHHRDVLRDAGEVQRAVFGDIEGTRKMRGQLTRAVVTDDRDHTTRYQCLHDLAFRVTTAVRGGMSDGCLVTEDLRLQSLQLGTRLDAELVDEPRARALIDVERLCLTPTAVKRQHQLAAERLAQRMLADEPLELADDIAVAAELEVRLDALLERDHPQLLEPPDLGLRKGLERELRERRPAP